MWRGMLIVLSICLAWQPASAEQRLALLIGNQSYAKAVGPLTNPHNDIARVGAALKRLGFKVTLVKDAGFGRLHKAIKRHTSLLRRAGPGAIGFFYYSGHGASNAVSRTNYLIPTDVVSANNEQLWDNSVRLKRIIDELRQRAGNATHFVVFDACRNRLKLTKPGSKAVVQAKGFVPERRVPGMLIAYATAEGDVATDVGEGVGPYARLLSEELVKPGIEAVSMFRNVQLRMSEVTSQWPWLDLAPLPRVYLAGRQTKTELQAEQTFWSAIKNSKQPPIVRTYLERYPNGRFADLARGLIVRLKQERQRAMAAAAKEAEMRKAEEARRRAEAERQLAIRRQHEAKQAEELRSAFEEMRRIRDALSNAEQKRRAAEKAATEARKAAQLERDRVKGLEAASKDAELRKAEKAKRRSEADRQVVIRQEQEAKQTAKLRAALQEMQRTRDALRKAEEARKAAEKATAEARKAAQKEKARREALAKQGKPPPVVASLGPATNPAIGPGKGTGDLPTDPKELAALLQRELKRVGCYASTIDGDWGPASQSAMADFNRHAKMAFPAEVAMPEAITAIRKIFVRICPDAAPSPGSSRSVTVPPTDGQHRFDGTWLLSKQSARCKGNRTLRIRVVNGNLYKNGGQLNADGSFKFKGSYGTSWFHGRFSGDTGSGRFGAGCFATLKRISR